MFLRNGAVTPGPSRKCDITFFVKGRPKSAQRSLDSAVVARSVQSVTVSSSFPPGLRSPPRLKMPDLGHLLRNFEEILSNNLKSQCVKKEVHTTTAEN